MMVWSLIGRATALLAAMIICAVGVGAVITFWPQHEGHARFVYGYAIATVTYALFPAIQLGRRT